MAKRGLWTWDDKSQELIFLSTVRKSEDNEPVTSRYQYNFHIQDIVTESDRLKYRQYLRKNFIFKVENIVILEDIKRLVIFLLKQPIPKGFEKFFSLRIVNLWLRSLIVYMQYYLESRDELKRIEHLLPAVPTRGRPDRKLEMNTDLRDLRSVVGRFYCDMIMTVLRSDKKGFGSSGTGIKITELLLNVATRVVWIALSRHNLNFIVFEVNRLFRTEIFLPQCVKFRSLTTMSNVTVIGDSRKDKPKWHAKENRLAFQNSPLFKEFKNIQDQRLLLIGTDKFKDYYVEDERTSFLTACFFSSEADLARQGITVGILGRRCDLYDILLSPISQNMPPILQTAQRNSSDVHLNASSICQHLQIIPIPRQTLNIEF